MPSIPALVEAPLLVWARKRAGFSAAEAAAKADIASETLEAWEQGAGQPTVAELRKLGQVYKRPISVFFLPEPPKTFDPQQEFRRLPNVSASTESQQMRLALRRALYLREAALEISSGLNQKFPVVSETADPDEDADTVGMRIRGLSGISWREQLQWRTPGIGLNAWRTSIENLGVLVLQSSRVEVSEMRGTSIPRGPLPVILLNSMDSPHGKIFSLLHEFAHILLANAGHVTASMNSKLRVQDRVLERASNTFAAAALMPKEEFLVEAERFPDAFRGDDSSLIDLADRIKVSPEAILLRLVSLRKATLSLYNAKKREWRERPWFRATKSKSGPPVEVRIVANTGKPFVSLVLEGYRRSVVSSSDVSDYLGVQLKYLDSVRRQLAVTPRSSQS